MLTIMVVEPIIPHLERVICRALRNVQPADSIAQLLATPNSSDKQITQVTCKMVDAGKASQISSKSTGAPLISAIPEGDKVGFR